MKRTPKWAFFVVAILIVVFAYTAVCGVYTTYGDRVDTVIRGDSDSDSREDGVEVAFGAVDETIRPTADQLDAVKTIIERRLVSKGITDYEAYTDVANNRIVVRFPWGSATETPEQVVEWLGQTGMLEFRIGSDTDENGNPTGELVLNGNDIESAEVSYQENDGGPAEPVVLLSFNDRGKAAFSEATKILAANKGTLSIWLDDLLIFSPTVNEQITDGEALLTGIGSYEETKELVDLISSGALPFEIEAKTLSTM